MSTDKLKTLLIQHFKIINEAIKNAGGGEPPAELLKLLTDSVPTQAAPPAGAGAGAPPPKKTAEATAAQSRIVAELKAKLAQKQNEAAATDSPSPTSS
jgi:hypothetical protein